eukprot:m.35344 g.35344  ORF g.35344 m.35344 type:complete len:311 (+) comp13230_c1_seq1:527-1459(+)
MILPSCSYLCRRCCSSTRWWRARRGTRQRARMHRRPRRCCCLAAGRGSACSFLQRRLVWRCRARSLGRMPMCCLGPRGSCRCCCSTPSPWTSSTTPSWAEWMGFSRDWCIHQLGCRPPRSRLAAPAPRSTLRTRCLPWPATSCGGRGACTMPTRTAVWMPSRMPSFTPRATAACCRVSKQPPKPASCRPGLPSHPPPAPCGLWTMPAAVHQSCVHQKKTTPHCQCARPALSSPEGTTPHRTFTTTTRTSSETHTASSTDTGSLWPHCSSARFDITHTVGVGLETPMPALSTLLEAARFWLHSLFLDPEVL